MPTSLHQERMIPVLPLPKSGNVTSTNSIFLRQHVSISRMPTISNEVSRSDFLDLLKSKLCHCIFSSKRAPSFIGSVFAVLGMCAEPKMVRVNASDIVSSGAVVTNLFSFWNRSTEKHPTGSVRHFHSASCGSPANLSISSSHCARRPQPASVWAGNLVHFCQKSLRKGGIQSLRCKVLGRNLDHIGLVFAARVTGPAAFSF